jgi:hypothetical protein
MRLFGQFFLISAFVNALTAVPASAADKPEETSTTTVSVDKDSAKGKPATPGKHKGPEKAPKGTEENPHTDKDSKRTPWTC